MRGVVVWSRVGVLFCAVTIALGQEVTPEEVAVELVALVVIEVTHDDGTSVESFMDAEMVFPGQVIEYRLVATNRSGALVPAGRLTLVGPVPESTWYLAESASPSGQDWRLEASLDGETFAEPPLFVVETDADGREVDVEAEPAEYRALRWVVLRALQPDKEIVLRYRVVVR